VRYITQTAILVALTAAWQAGTAPLGQTLLTGSGVNLLLIIAVSACSLPTGLSVAAITPFTAAMLGIGTPFVILSPFIALGNLSIVIVWHLLRKVKPIAVIAGAAVKFAVLYFAVVKTAVPLFIPEKAATALSAAFSFPQLITALVGGVVALPIIHALKKTEAST